MEHLSDCAVHNEPAYPKGYCNCGADIVDEARGFLVGMIADYLNDYENGRMTLDRFIKDLAEDILVLKGNNFYVNIGSNKQE